MSHQINIQELNDQGLLDSVYFRALLIKLQRDEINYRPSSSNK